ncbi:alpha/beta hydrolase [Streptomyces sp. B3I8]|uniref:alpha/beta hydrolase n=1 Tax=Streptomyces sp. B3I8 TaxID=3042303 RepID=UPI00277D6DCD|nr:alpha/beta hydrolase [Streptomyces sp. B3I8]MDQ0790811.1 acetyl esterase/lipase [Streptomyces sp. B3I8]
MSLMPPPIDPELAAAVDLDSLRITLTHEVIGELREVSAPMPTLDQLRRGGAFTVEERIAHSGSGGSAGVPLLLCRPIGVTGRPPVLYYLHGGGMVMGHARQHLDYVLRWAEELRAAVVSVEYRLAPEHPYPAALDDAAAGMAWVAAHAQEAAVDPERVLLVGFSGGGAVAAGLALRLRDENQYRPVGQMLVCPMLDDRNDTLSAFQLAGSGGWNRATNEAAWRHVLGPRRGAPDVPVYAAPARAEDLSGLPPTYLEAGSAETFRDEVVAYASRIWAAGGNAELHVFPGGFHGFDFLAPEALLSRDARDARLKWLHRTLPVQP